MWHKVRTALSLPPGDWWVLAQAWILLLAVDLGLRWMPFQQVVKWSEWDERFAHRSRTGDVVGKIRRLSGLVRIAANHHLYPMTCLRQALALQRLLLMEGIASELRIGVRKDAGALDAHAWLEVQGVPVGQSRGAVENFAPLVTLEAGS